MSVDQIGDQSLPAFEAHRPQVAGGHLRTIGTSTFADTVEALLLSVSRGDQEAFVALQSHIADLVRVNVRRVLRDASRSEAVTQATLAEVLQDAISFDPHRNSAQTWLLTRAHERAMQELRSLDVTDGEPDATRIDESASALPA